MDGGTGGGWGLDEWMSYGWMHDGQLAGWGMVMADGRLGDG